jgi:hypothetical protein
MSLSKKIIETALMASLTALLIGDIGRSYCHSVNPTPRIERISNIAFKSGAASLVSIGVPYSIYHIKNSRRKYSED